MDHEHTIILIIGRTGAGKDTLVDELCKRNNLKQLISYSTRPRRINEGETHNFVSESDYEAMKSSNNIGAYTCINGYHYWCSIDQLYESDIYIIDPKGVETLKGLNLPGLNIITIYINVPDEIRKERAINKRGDNIDIYRSRDLDERAQFRDFLQNAKFDYCVSNTDFAKAYSILKWICDVEQVWLNKDGDIF